MKHFEALKIWLLFLERKEGERKWGDSNLKSRQFAPSIGRGALPQSVDFIHTAQHNRSEREKKRVSFLISFDSNLLCSVCVCVKPKLCGNAPRHIECTNRLVSRREIEVIAWKNSRIIIWPNRFRPGMNFKNLLPFATIRLIKHNPTLWDPPSTFGLRFCLVITWPISVGIQNSTAARVNVA